MSQPSTARSLGSWLLMGAILAFCLLCIYKIDIKEEHKDMDDLVIVMAQDLGDRIKEGA